MEGEKRGGQNSWPYPKPSRRVSQDKLFNHGRVQNDSPGHGGAIDVTKGGNLLAGVILAYHLLGPLVMKEKGK